MERAAGILMPVTSLPSDYGIGTLGKESYDFCDFLCRAGIKYWQILPIGHTGFGDSPYQSLSAYAGNPYWIDLEMLIKSGLLLPEEACGGTREGKINYAKLHKNRQSVLKKAAARFDFQNADYVNFCEKNSVWLSEYAYFAAKKLKNGEKPFWQWGKSASEPEKADIDFYKFIQYIFFSQYFALKRYAAERGIGIIGDIPIYVSADSADCYFSPKIFQLKSDKTTKSVAGCPPDYFSPDGQLWGNPLYNYKNKKEVFRWWIERLRFSAELFDIVRIDHFRGFESYFSIPEGGVPAEGEWVKAPGKELFEAIKKELPNLRIIAEDLGHRTPEIDRLLDFCGFPGMKVLQFAFDGDPRNPYLPQNYEKNCVCYTGTHDNSTLAGFLKAARPHEKEAMVRYFGTKGEAKTFDFIMRAAFSSVSDLCIIPMQDFLKLSDEARINIPSTGSGNWVWRLKKAALTEKLADEIRSLVWIYGRE